MACYFGKHSHRFTFEFLRQNLSQWYYDNWMIDDIQYELQDNWLREELERLLRRGYTVELAIDKLRNIFYLFLN